MSVGGGDTSSPALEALLLPLRDGTIAHAPDSEVLFLNARTGWPLRQLPGLRWRCVQSFKPFAQALQNDGLSLDDDGQSRYPLVLLLPPRQRDEARAMMAQALLRVAPGGTVLACVPNSEGSRSAEADMARLAGTVRNVCKHKCRAFWVAIEHAHVDHELLQQWAALDAPRKILDGRFVSRPGLFAWDRIDPASALLASHLPATLRGRGADLGAGFGFLSAHVLSHCSGVTAMDLYEAQARALDLARSNLAPHQARVAVGFHWHDVCAGLTEQYDFIVTNPPFHVGGDTRVDVGRAFIASAAAALRPGGELWLVANRQLPYEAVLGARFGTVHTVAQAHGYKVVRAIKAART